MVLANLLPPSFKIKQARGKPDGKQLHQEVAACRTPRRALFQLLAVADKAHPNEYQRAAPNPASVKAAVMHLHGLIRTT